MADQEYDRDGNPVDVSYDRDGKPVILPSADIKTATEHVAAGKPVPHPVVAKLLDLLPALGATAGGWLGAGAGTVFGMGVGAVPGAIGGAGLGGATGAALRTIGNYAVGNPTETTKGDVAASIGKEGAMGVVSEAVPLGAAKFGRDVVAPALMRSAVRPSAKALRAAGELETAPDVPTIVQTMLDTPSAAVSNRGVRALNAAQGAATKAKNQIIQNLGGKVSPSQVEALAQGYADTLAVPAEKKIAQREIDAFVEKYVRDPKTGRMRSWMDPQTADVAKTQYRKGGIFGLDQPAKIQTRKVIGAGLRRGLELLDSTGELASVNTKWGNLDDALEAAANANAAWKNSSREQMSLMSHLWHNPVARSYIARGLYDQAAAVSGIPMFVLRALDASLNVAAEPESETTK